MSLDMTSQDTNPARRSTLGEKLIEIAAFVVPILIVGGTLLFILSRWISLHLTP
jgi:hypothetical protein